MTRKKETQKLNEAPVWMWGIGLFGLALILGSIGFMIYQAAVGESSPPDVTVQTQSIVTTRNGYLVTFRAVNEGGSTAEGLTVEGVLRRNGNEIVESSSTVIQYLPAHSEREGGLFFAGDPRQHELLLRAKGYEKP
ncbi:MAG TPA: hypothetical protein VJU86_01575 [Pyrinomonadaceae bacterium]|nr:hypothetical protein [Pyrinomonadaceae bacterium]